MHLQAVTGHAAPVRKVPTRERRGDLVRRCLHGPCEAGVPSVGPNSHSSLLGHQRASLPRTTPDTADFTGLGDELLDHEPLAKLGACLDCGIDEQFVQCQPARAVTQGDTVDNQISPRERAVAEVRSHRLDRWTPRGYDTVQQTPALEVARSMAMDELSVRDVAGKRGAVDEEDFVPLARQEHRG